MKLFKTIVAPMLILCVSSSLILAEDGLLSRILPREKETPKTAETAPAATTPAATTPAIGEVQPADKVADKVADKITDGQTKAKCAADCKNLKRSTDPMVEEFEEQVWICQACPCVIVVKKAGLSSLHHCGKPMCLKKGKGAVGKTDSSDKDNDMDDKDDEKEDDNDEKDGEKGE